MYSKKPIICLLFVCIYFTVALSNDIFYAKIYPEDDPAKLAFTHNNNISTVGDSTIIDHFYYTPDGELYAKDKVVLINDKPVFNSLKFYKIEEYSSFKLNGDEAELCFEREGKRRYVTRKMKTPLVFAPIQQNAIKKYFSKLISGETVKFNIFASEVLHLVEMKVFMIENSKYEREGCVVFIMRPKNIFIDWFVDEVYYVVERSTGRLMEMHGFSTLRQKIDDKWEFKDMDFYYSYE